MGGAVANNWPATPRPTFARPLAKALPYTAPEFTRPAPRACAGEARSKPDDQTSALSTVIARQLSNATRIEVLVQKVGYRATTGA